MNHLNTLYCNALITMTVCIFTEILLCEFFQKWGNIIYPVYKNVTMLSEHNWVSECPYIQRINVATY